MAAQSGSKLRVLCLHGSRQDGEIFSQRLRKLSSKLSDILELHYVDAPHCLPRQKGQMVAMRCWWRHWNLVQQDSDDGGDDDIGGVGTERPSSSSPSNEAFSDVEEREAAGERRRFREEMKQKFEDGGWDGVVCGDWDKSLKVIDAAWKEAAGFDGVLGFSNGAAAAFLFAVHASTHPLKYTGLKFVILAGGYRPDPLSSLVPSHLVTFSEEEGVSQLATPLKLPSLHMMGKEDEAVTVEDSRALAENFEPSTRTILEHELSHCVPQKAAHISAIREFLHSFASAPNTATSSASLHRKAASSQDRGHSPHGRRQGKGAGQEAGPSGRAHDSRQGQVEGHVAGSWARTGADGHRPHDIRQGKGVGQEASLQEKSREGGREEGQGPSQGPKDRRSLQQGNQQRQPPPPLQQQQQQQEGGTSGTTSAPSPSAAATSAALTASAPFSGATPSAEDTAPSIQEQVQGGPVSEEQLEEMEALAAIFGEEYCLIRDTAPPRFTVYLREPGTVEEDSAQQGLSEIEKLKIAAGLMASPRGDQAPSAPLGPPSKRFSLLFTLPKGYPLSAPPEVFVQGPLSNADPRRLALMQTIQECAMEAMESTAAGSVFQLVEVAKEWIDSNLPDDVGLRRDGEEAGPDELATQEESGMTGGQGPDRIPWWEKEEADGELVKRAIAEVSAAHWSRYHGTASVSSHQAGTSAAEDEHTELEDAVIGSDAFSGGRERGRWDYVVGMVGKPSAGKSTFYNAIIDPVSEEEAARVAAFPFTTISPNVGRGMFLVPDPAPALGIDPQTCGPLHGHVPSFDLARVSAEYNGVDHMRRWLAQGPWQVTPDQQGDAADGTAQGGAVLWRRVPVILKDVAGLVPGAYQGRGRGNAFLNDLCDADVLIHVVDASGMTDSEGQALKPGEGHDPIEDIGWVKEELHRWVYSNLCTKWPSVLGRPSRLPAMFSGYSCSRALVYEVLERVGVAPKSLSEVGASLAHWGEWEVHKLVATFLQVRFPILLALNKADMVDSAAHIRRIRLNLPQEPAVAVSAASERWLCQQRRAGAVQYEAASCVATCLPGCADDAVHAKVAEINRRVLHQYGSTGALAALSAAIAMRPPRTLFPIGDMDTCAAIAAKTMSGTTVLGSGQDAKARFAEGSNPSVLRDCILLKPGSTVEDAYTVLRKPPFQLIDGEFVRADCRILSSSAVGRRGKAGRVCSGGTASVQVLKKDEVLSSSTCVARFLTNRRSSGWQAKH